MTNFTAFPNRQWLRSMRGHCLYMPTSLPAAYHAACLPAYVLHADGGAGPQPEDAAVSDGAQRCPGHDGSLHPCQHEICETGTPQGGGEKAVSIF